MLLVLIWILMAVGVGKLAEKYNRSMGNWAIIALLLSPLVAIIALLIMGAVPSPIARTAAPRMVRCRHCSEAVPAGTRVCASCGQDLFDQVPVTVPRKIEGFFYHDNGENEGPFSPEDIRAMYSARTITDATPICRAGESDWHSFRDYPELVG